MKTFWNLNLFLALCLVPVGARAGVWNTNSDDVVLDGYDVVAYFNAAEAVRGRVDLSATHDGVIFHFSSTENRSAFRQQPEKYLPKFGGFCAFGVAANKAKVPVDPETFKIYNGELLVFFNDLYQGEKVNTKVMWNGSERDLYQQATEIWPTLE